MTTKVFTLIVAALFFCSLSFATIRRVGYPGIPITGVDYPDPSTADAAANPGDTIQIYSGPTTGTIDKQLVIIGYGYNLATDALLQAIGTIAPSSVNITFGFGSNGTIVSGLSGSFTFVDATETSIGISNINFYRCNGTFSFQNNISEGPINNIGLFDCVVNSIFDDYPLDSYGIPVTNIGIFNCILGSVNLIGGPGESVIINNCVSTSPSISSFSLGLNSATALVNNCIFANSNSGANLNTVYTNCFFGDAQPTTFPSGKNNRWGQDWGTIFNRLGGSSDNPGYSADPTFAENYYILKSGSPAINGGFTGSNVATDCGIFGGDAGNIYKLGGIPAVPAIYKLSAPGVGATSNPYNITISVRSNN